MSPSNKYTIAIFIILLTIFVHTDGKKLGLRVKNRNHLHNRVLHFANSFTKAFPNTWVGGFNYDIISFENSADYNCKNLYDLTQLYGTFLNEFTSINKSDVQDTSTNLEKVLALISSIKENLESKNGAPTLVEVNLKAYKNKAKALNYNPCLEKLILAYNKQNAYKVLATIEKQDLSMLAMSIEIESKLKELIMLCQDFLNNYASYSSILTSKKSSLDHKLESMNTDSTSVCPTNQVCKNGSCQAVAADSSSSGTPSSDPPISNTPSSDPPISNTPSSDTPSSDTPSSDTPSSNTPSSDTSSSNTPSSGTPSSDSSSSANVITNQPSVEATSNIDYSGTYFIKTYLGRYACAEGNLFGAYSMSKYACAQFQIILNRKISSKNAYCIKSIALGAFVSISSSTDPTLISNENTCSLLGEFYIDQDSYNGQTTFYFTSVSSGGIVSTSLTKLMTANKYVREESENLFLESGDVDSQLNYEGKYHLKSRFNSYVCPLVGNLSSSSPNKAACSAYAITLKGLKYGQNVYCIQNIKWGVYFYSENYNSPDESLRCQFSECTSWSEFFISEKVVDSTVYTFFTSAATGRIITTEDSLSLTAYREQDDNNFGLFTLVPFIVPVPGKYYFVKSRYGRYLDLKHDPVSNSYAALSINEKTLNSNMYYAQDGFVMKLVAADTGYYYLNSESGRNIDMRQVSSTSPVAVNSLSDLYMKSTMQYKNSYMVKLDDQNDGFYKIESKYGRFLHMRQESLSTASVDAWSVKKSYMTQNSSAEDSYCVEFIPV